MQLVSNVFPFAQEEERFISKPPFTDEARKGEESTYVPGLLRISTTY